MARHISKKNGNHSFYTWINLRVNGITCSDNAEQLVIIDNTMSCPEVFTYFHRSHHPYVEWNTNDPFRMIYNTLMLLTSSFRHWKYLLTKKRKIRNLHNGKHYEDWFTDCCTWICLATEFVNVFPRQVFFPFSLCFENNLLFLVNMNLCA